jgi:hypothetical protein
MDKISIYVYSQHHTRAGMVATEPQGDDTDLYAEGTREEIVAQAAERLSKRYDTRPGGSGDHYAHKCARNVLAYLA